MPAGDRLVPSRAVWTQRATHSLPLASFCPGFIPEDTAQGSIAFPGQAPRTALARADRYLHVDNRWSFYRMASTTRTRSTLRGARPSPVALVRRLTRSSEPWEVDRSSPSQDRLLTHGELWEFQVCNSNYARGRDQISERNPGLLTRKQAKGLS